MISGWRARLHYWSRQSSVLTKAALWLAGGGFASAWLFTFLMPRQETPAAMHPMEQGLRNEWQRLHHLRDPDPRRLSQWLRDVLPRLQHLSDAAGLDHSTWEAFRASGRLAGFEVRPLLEKHAAEPETAQLFQDFIETFLQEAPDGEAARRLQVLAERPEPPPLANELHAALLAQRGAEAGALEAFVREARRFEEAVTAREDAARLAIKLRDLDALRFMAETPGWLESMPALVQYEAGRHLNDFWIMGRGLMLNRMEDLPLPQVLQALFAAALWYVILILQSTPRRWRWLLPLWPLAAGIASVWPTLWIGAWQETTLGMDQHAPFPHDLWFWVIGVGLREETAKLALFALFLPWLLWRRVPGLALMTGAFVGLGFALEENIDYYSDYGGGVALTRLLTANFIHVALTGIAAHALYEMLRTRFARADRFIGTFLAMVVIHGLYNFSSASGRDEGIYLRMALLAFTAWHFLDLVAHEAPAARQIVAPAAVFLIGTALLVAASFWISAFESRTAAAVTGTAADCLGILPVAFLYRRRLE